MQNDRQMTWNEVVAEMVKFRNERDQLKALLERVLLLHADLANLVEHYCDGSEDEAFHNIGDLSKDIRAALNPKENDDG